jgi:hypothetical protein
MVMKDAENGPETVRAQPEAMAGSRTPHGRDASNTTAGSLSPHDAYGIHASAPQEGRCMNGCGGVTHRDSVWSQIMIEGGVVDQPESAMSYGKSDARLARRGAEVLDAIVAKNSLVLRKIGGGRAGEVATGRFLDNADVTVATIAETAAQRTLVAARGRRVLAIQDTTEVNFSGRAGRRTSLGPTSPLAATASVPDFSAIPCCWSTSSMKPCSGSLPPTSGRGRMHQLATARSV